MLVDEKPNETVDGAGPEPEAPPRRPIWPVAIFLGGLVVALLGAAVLLDQRYRPRIGVEPAGVAVVPSATPDQRPAVQAMAPPTAVATSTVAPSTAPTSAPTATALAPATAAPTAAVIRSPAAAPGQAVLTPLQKEIVDAYLRYWDIRIRAYYDLDASRLPEVMAGDELAREQKQIAEFRATGRAAKLDIEHDFRISRATPNEATIYDEYINRSVFMDPITKREIATSQPEVIEKVTFQLKKLDGVWKVVDGARHA